MESGTPTILTEKDDGRTVRLANGALLTIRIQGNRTTGYRWEANVSDASVLTEGSAPLYTPTSTSPGAGGIFEFSFRAGAAGQTRLTLGYRRSWETEIPPLRIFEVSVEVR